MMVIIDAVMTMAKSMLKNGQKVTEAYSTGSISGRKNKYPKHSPAGRNGNVAEVNQNWRNNC